MENQLTDTNIKKQQPGIMLFFIKLFQILLYIPIQIIFIPFAIIGLIIGVYKEMVLSKKLGVSFSAGQALQYRWIMHYFNTRPDPISVAFIKKFPCESHFGMWSIMGPLIISQRLFGFTTRAVKLVEPGEETLDSTAFIRVLMFDRIMEKYVEKMEQIVIPGAGFDKTKKTLFLWQSVSLFLEVDIVKETLRKMADLCVDGSIIAQDFYSKAFILGEISKIAKRNMSLIEKMGAPWIFGIDMSNDPKAAVESFLKECGLKMTEYIQFGEKLDIEPFYCIVEAEKL